MRSDVINAFLQAATEVLESELGSKPRRGTVGLQRSTYTTLDVTAVVAVTGDAAGMVMLGMDESTACAIVARMMGQEFASLDALAQSGIAEIGNVITGRAAVLLSEAGYASDIAPPMLLVGANAVISTLDVHRLVIPIETDLGNMEIQVALKLSGAAARRAA